MIVAARCFVLSVKYGKFSPEYLQLFRNRILTSRIIDRANIATAVNNYKPEAIAKKVREAMTLLSIREENFNIKVFVD